MMQLESMKKKKEERNMGADRWTKWSREIGKVNKRLKETRDRRKKDNFPEAFHQHLCEHTAGLTVSVMKRALSVRPITSDWCSWVADW